jgi:hypothetical protein
MNIRSLWRPMPAVTSLLLAVLLLASFPAHAERVQGLFTFQDSKDNTARPINNAKVEIWRFAPRFLGIWSWGMDQRVWTDSNGWIDVEMPWAGADVLYRVRVYAANDHITVWPHDTAHTGESWYNELPEQRVADPGAVLDFTHHYDWELAARNYNMARAGWFAGEYMAQTYSNLPKVNAQTTDMFSTFYDPAGDTMQVEPSHAFDDFAIAHEYGHFIEEQIGSLPWRPTVHTLCGVYDPGLAWMEGFADFYANAVARAFPGEMQGGAYALESGTYCVRNQPDSTEYFVAAVLWDLLDDGTGFGSSDEAYDKDANNAALILSILDEELGAYGSQPTIWDFRNAWHNRRPWAWSQIGLDRIYAHHGLLPPFNHAMQSALQVSPEMRPGGTYTAHVSMWNTGSTTWSSGALYALGSQDPQDNTFWGTHRVSLPRNVAPGELVTFDFPVTAPPQVGLFPFRWQMVQDTVEWFGDVTLPHSIVVTGTQNAQFLSQSVPTSMQAHHTYNVSVTLKNTGDTTWVPGSYFLGSRNPQDNTTWGKNRVPLPYAAGPGGQVTFSFTVTAPASSGSYNFQWQLFQSDLSWWIGDVTPNVSVWVSEPAPTCNQSQCSSQCIEDGCRGGTCNSSGNCQCLRCL